MKFYTLNEAVELWSCTQSDVNYVTDWFGRAYWVHNWTQAVLPAL